MENALQKLPKLELKSCEAEEYENALNGDPSSYGDSIYTAAMVWVIFVYLLAFIVYELFVASMSLSAALCWIILPPLIPSYVTFSFMEGKRKKAIKRILSDSKKKYFWSLREAVRTCNLQIDRFNEGVRRFKLGCAEKNEACLIATRAQLEEARQDLQKRIWFEDKDPSFGESPDLLEVSEQIQALQAAESELAVSSNERTLLKESPEYQEALKELEKEFGL